MLPLKTPRRDRDVLKGVQQANERYISFFTQNKFKITLNGYTGVSFEKEMNNSTVTVLLNTMGRLNETKTQLTITISHTINTSFAISKSIPPLWRIGLHKINTNLNGIKAYSHDIDWGKTLVQNMKMIQFCERFNTHTSFQILPYKIIYIEPVYKGNDESILSLITDVIEFLESPKKLNSPKDYQPSFIQKNKTPIALTIGVLGAVLIFKLLILAYFAIQ